LSLQACARFEIAAAGRQYLAMPRSSRRRTPPVLAIAALALFALPQGACGLREASLAGRCAEVMKSAFPDAGIKVTQSSVTADPAATSIAAAVASVEGVRETLPAESKLPRDVAVECRFSNNVLTDFRWTRGPLQ
jgi:hypothetical protein